MTSKKSYLIWFASVFGILAGVTFLVTGQATGARKDVDFNDIPPGNFLVLNRTPESWRMGVKMSHLAKTTPPRIGLFGNHFVQFIGRPNETKGEDIPQDSYFNYHNGHNTPEEILDILLYAEALGKLPTELIAVGIPNPYSVVQTLIGHHGNIQPEVEFAPAVIAKLPLEWRLLRMKDRFIHLVERRINWASLAYGLSNSFWPSFAVGLFEKMGINQVFQRWALKQQTNFTSKPIEWH